jgi:hypothetical protein
MDLLELWWCAQFKDMFSMEESSMTPIQVNLSMPVAYTSMMEMKLTITSDPWC